MSAPTRRFGAVTSKKRDELLDCVERLMAREGYAAVTYRAVAAKAEVTPGLVQYYFPTLDDLFKAAIRRRSDRTSNGSPPPSMPDPTSPCEFCGRYSQEESTAALTTEFLALGNHRSPSPRRSPR